MYIFLKDYIFSAYLLPFIGHFTISRIIVVGLFDV